MLIPLAAIVAGFVLLPWGADRFITGAAALARNPGVQPLLIGLTVVGLGTSAPEILAAIAAAPENEHDIAIGNILGSNLYNLLAVLCMPGLIAPSEIPAEVLHRDLPVMLIMTLAVFLMAQRLGRQGRINRFEAATLFAGFIGYQTWIFLDAQGGMD